MSNGIICFGEMLWDILPEKELPGGAVMNVAYHLQQLGEQVSLVSRVGRDARGQGLLDMLNGYGLDTSLVQVDEQVETGKVYADMTNPHDVHYDIVYPAAWDFIQWTPGLAARLKDTATRYLVFGSLCSRHEVSLHTLQQALKERVVKVLDINLRAPHYTREHIEWLLGECHLLKLNITELELICNWYHPYTDKEQAVRLISERFHIYTIVVTMGADGALLFANDLFYAEPGIAVEVADTIGSGDAFLAGFLHSVIRGRPARECLVFANALGALVASFAGGAPDYDVNDILKIQG
ncbi:carbohydrate kinase family protein [Chitinophaga arvensicola]|uniref:Fructokinase n=1 Tax=Chitinophaga arvensicola TaxID=29529 RepID=A0A1I0SBS6_9BACT|nr:carbohydrate kinase [Chitinophaga arvensicola]SEW54021.1 fructokinase [Chitinophaga arvensicola]